MEKETIAFDELKKETYPEYEDQGAYLLEIDDFTIWIPKSQCENMDESENTVDVAVWFIEENELDEYMI